jgi:hypothetical protein
MLPQRESLPGVTAAAVVAVIFAVVGILGCGLILLSLAALPNLESTSNVAPMPEGTRVFAAVLYCFFLAICFAELVVAIHVFRRRNWARIVMLVWAGLMVAMSLFGMLGIFLIGAFVPPATTELPNPTTFMAILRVFMLVFYSVPLGVGIWWLILFTRPRVVAAFQCSSAGAQIPVTIDASGFPAPAASILPATPKRPSVPVPIAVIAAIDVSGAVWMILMLFLPFPYHVPFFLFGFQIPNVPYKAFLGFLGAAYILFVVGIFKLRRWGLDSLLIVKALFLFSGIVTLFNPKFMDAMDEMMADIMAKNSALPNGLPVFGHGFMQTILGFSYSFAVALLVVMLIYRGRFLKASAEAIR